MALSRKDLESILSGYEVKPEDIEKIISGHTESINGLKAERDLYKGERDTYKTKYEEAEPFRTKASEWETKYNNEHSAFESFKTAQSEAETLTQKKEAYKALLKDSGVYEKVMDSVLNATDFSKIELEEGKIKDIDTHKETIKSTWGGFITETHEEGAGTDNPPDGNDGGGNKPLVPTIF